MLGEMVARLAASGITARAAVADSWGAAHAVARWLARPDASRGPRAARARRRCGPCRSPRCACRATSSTACARSASSGSASWRRSRARRWRCGSARRSAGGSTRRWVGWPSRSRRSARPSSSRSVAPSPSRSARRRPSRAISASWSSDLCARLEQRGLGARRLDLIFKRVDFRARRACDRRRATEARSAPSDATALRADRQRRSRLRHRADEPHRHPRRTDGRRQNASDLVETRPAEIADLGGRAGHFFAGDERTRNWERGAGPSHEPCACTIDFIPRRYVQNKDAQTSRREVWPRRRGSSQPELLPEVVFIDETGTTKRPASRISRAQAGSRVPHGMKDDAGRGAALDGIAALWYREHER